jgi:hypothetical protein
MEDVRRPSPVGLTGMGLCGDGNGPFQRAHSDIPHSVQACSSWPFLTLGIWFPSVFGAGPWYHRPEVMNCPGRKEQAVVIPDEIGPTHDKPDLGGPGRESVVTGRLPREGEIPTP